LPHLAPHVRKYWFFWHKKFTGKDYEKMNDPKTLSHFRPDIEGRHHVIGDGKTSPDSAAKLANRIPTIQHDVTQKTRAMARISTKQFVDDAHTMEFRGAQDWITSCADQVKLPVNFCGGVLIIRLCRRLVPTELQTDEWSSAVHDLAAAYDFAFLALGHADDEADLTTERDGFSARWTTHPQTRAVDGINLLLAGITAAQDILSEWPKHALLPKPDAKRIIDELLRALREASFPILLDKSGLGYVRAKKEDERHGGLQIDASSMARVALYARHRAHTYFLRAFRIAVLAAGYKEIESELENLLDRLLELLASIGAASDDMQDTFVDFSVRTHSAVSVMAHLCVAQEGSLRPPFRREVEDLDIQSQRQLLFEVWGVNSDKLDRQKVFRLFDVIGLRKALHLHYEPQCIEFANCMYKAVKDYGFSVDFMSEIVAFVCQDMRFSIPSQYFLILESLDDISSIEFANREIGKYITNYLLDRFLPSEE
jgi:hypothetical protein